MIYLFFLFLLKKLKLKINKIKKKTLNAILNKKENNYH